MPLNDADSPEFNSHLQDEYMFDAHYPPGVEIGGDEEFQQAPLNIDKDRGSGSYAQDGRLEVADDGVNMDGENQIGSAAMYGPTEIGNYSEAGAFEIGNYSEHGAVEIGEEVQMPFESFMLDDVHMGSAHAADRAGHEIGSAAMYGPTEIGNYSENGAVEIGNGYIAQNGPSEIGAVTAVIEKARDNRRPAPPMKAVALDAPNELDDWGLTDVVVGAALGHSRYVGDAAPSAAAAPPANPFPLTTEFMLRAGTNVTPRYVRVDTEQSYGKFRAENSPELAELQQRLAEHVNDEHAHNHEFTNDDLTEDIEDLVVLGEQAQAAEDAKRVDLWMPKRYDGLVEAWKEGNFVCVSMMLPGTDGEVRICTSFEPIKKCVEEMSRHAAEANVAASDVIGALPAMGCVLGAGTIMKEMASAAPEILQQAEAVPGHPFAIRIEPKTNPALAALAMLAWECRNGNQQACAEWQALSDASPGPVRQAMTEAAQLAKAAA